MKPFLFLKTPFPSPKRTREKFIWILVIGVGCSLFIFLYNPFEIAKQTGERLFIDLVIFSLGILFSLSIIFMEWVIPMLVPKVFQNWNIGKALIWYTLVVLFAGVVIFFYKNFWDGFNEFTLASFLFVMMRILAISFTVSLFLVGVSQLLNKRRISTLISGENFEIRTPDGKSTSISLSDILYAMSDDNYVDIHYLEDGKRTKLILRSSLKNIENQIVNPISSVCRCHRQYLVNTHHVEIEKASSRSVTLRLINEEDRIPVSSQYVELIKKRCSLATKS